MIKLKKAEEIFLSHSLCHRSSIDCALYSKIFKEIGSETIFQIAKANNIESIVASSLIHCFDKTDIEHYWIEAYDSMENRIGLYMKELDRVANVLNAEDIDVVALKNSGITRGLYPFYAASPMGDLDILIRKSDFYIAHKTLVNNGYKLKFRSPLEEEDIDKAYLNGGSEYYIYLENGERMWLELQWRPVSGRWIRQDQEPDAGLLISNSVPIINSKVRILAPEDNLLQVCLHTAKHSFIRAPGFRLNTDVDRIVIESQIDWNIFINKVKNLQIMTPVYFSLVLAKDFVNTPIPESVFKELKPQFWKIFIIKHWLIRLGLFYPDNKKWGKIGYVIFVSLLYDSLFGLTKGIFPNPNWMKSHYKFNSNFLLPYFYLLRLYNLLTKRNLNS